MMYSRYGGINPGSAHDIKGKQKDTTLSGTKERKIAFDVLKGPKYFEKAEAVTAVSTDQGTGSLYRQQSSEHIERHLNLQARIGVAHTLLRRANQEMKKSQEMLKTIRVRVDQFKVRAATYDRGLEQYQEHFRDFVQKKSDTAIYQRSIQERSATAFAMNEKLQKEYATGGIVAREEALDADKQRYRREEKAFDARLGVLLEQQHVIRQRIQAELPPGEQPSNERLMIDQEYRLNRQQMIELYNERHPLQVKQMDLEEAEQRLASDKAAIRSNYKNEIRLARLLPIHTSFELNNKYQSIVQEVQNSQNIVTRTAPKLLDALQPVEIASVSHIVEDIATEVHDQQIKAPAIASEVKILQDGCTDIQRSNERIVDVKQDLVRTQDQMKKTCDAATRLMEDWWQHFKHTSFFYPSELARPHQDRPEISVRLESSCNIYATRAILQDMGKDVNGTFNEQHVSQAMEFNQGRARTMTARVIKGVNINSITDGFKKLGVQAEMRRLPLSAEQVERETGRGNYMLAHLNIDINGDVIGHAIAIKGIQTDPVTHQRSYVVADIMTRRAGSWQLVPAHYIDLSTESFHVVYRDAKE